MLLQRLVEYEQRVGAVGTENERPTGFEPRAVPWLIYLRDDQVHFVRTSGGGVNDRGKEMLIPYVKKTSATRPQLLVGPAEYVLGVGDPEKPSRASERHAAFKALTAACAAILGDPLVERVVEFLDRLPTAPVQLPDDLKASDFVAFDVEGTRPIEQKGLRDFWARCKPFFDQKGLGAITRDAIVAWLTAERKTDDAVACMLCGRRGEIARTHPAIRVPRAVADQQLAIVSANKDAFYSYGLEQSLIAPLGLDCAEAYVRGLNRLAADRERHLVVGRIMYIFWTREPEAEFSFGPMVRQPTAAQVKELYESAFTARGGATKAVGDDSAFYAAALSGSGGRAVVRDWIDTTVGEAKARLAQWFDLQRIIAGAEVGDPLSLRQLASATMPRPRGAKLPDPPPANVSRSLLRTALTGAPLPHDLLLQVLRRTLQARPNQNPVTQHRAALIKMVLLSHRTERRRDEMVELDRNNSDPGYLCGRLLALLEETQYAALGDVGASVIVRFYGAASTAPATVFGDLVKGAQPHFATLKRDKPWLYKPLQRRFGQVFAELHEFPRTLSPEKRGMFAIGYYHERQRRFAGKPSDDNIDENANAGADAPDDDKE